MSSRATITLPAHVVALNYFTFIFIASGVALAHFITNSLWQSIIIFFVWVYFLPPLLARIIIVSRGKPIGIVHHLSHTHNTWWVLFQLQLVFNRFPFLEEILRSIPGLYAFWLNLWGAKVSPYVFWSPGIIVMDRYHLHINKGAILGTGSLISGHVLRVQEDGSILLLVDKVLIESGVLVGAKASLTPGCHIHPFETVPAGQILKPYTHIIDGKRKTFFPNSTYSEIIKNKKVVLPKDK